MLTVTNEDVLPAYLQRVSDFEDCLLATCTKANQCDAIVTNISCKRVGGQEIIERCHEDISVKKKYIIAFSEMASLCITKASELLGENIIINRIFLINPSKAKESDLYLGDISIIDGNSVAIKSWEKAVLGNVREFESNSNDIFDIIMRELENDK